MPLDVGAWTAEGTPNEPNNSALQIEVFRGNVDFMLQDLLKSGIEIPFFEQLGARREIINNLGGWGQLQKDVASLYVLIDNGYLFTKNNLKKDLGDIDKNSPQRIIYTDFYKVAEKFVTETSKNTDIDIHFPQMVQDAIDSQKSSGQKPPAADMQKAVIYVGDRAFSALNNKGTL